jgi:hypothetical protein
MKLRILLITLVSAVCILTALQIGFTQATAPQTPDSSKTTGDALYQVIRRKGSLSEDFNGAVATVNGLVLKRDAATFKFNSGEIYFLTPIEGQMIGAVFLGDVEMRVVPPTDVEKRSLEFFTGSNEQADHFSRLVMRFTDKTFEEIKQAPGVQMTADGSQTGRARDAYRDIQNFFRKDVHYNLDLRTLADVYAPDREGFFFAFPGGGRYDRLAFVMDGVSDGFKMLVPIYVDFGKGWTRLGAARMVGNSTVEIPAPLPQLPKKVTLCALDDVLYTSFDSK